MRGTVEYADADLNPFGDMIYRMVKKGFINATSISWLPLEWKFSTDRTRQGGIDFIKEDLLEIAYLSLGRALDVFSEVGDAIHFFMKRHHLTEGDLALMQIVLREETTLDKELKADILAIEEMFALDSASAACLSFDSKMRLVPEHLHIPFIKYFRNENDTRAISLFSVIVGLLGAACIFSLFFSHFGAKGEIFWGVQHCLVVGTTLMNFIVYLYLIDMAMVRRDVQAFATKKCTSLCAQMQERLEIVKRAGKRHVGDAILESINARDELRSVPNAPTDDKKSPP